MPTRERPKRGWYVGRDRRQALHETLPPGRAAYKRRPRRPETDAEALSEIVEGIRRLERASRVLSLSEDRDTRLAGRECRRLAMALRVLDRRMAEAVVPQPMETGVTDVRGVASRQYRKAAIHLGRAENLFLRKSLSPQAPMVATVIGGVVRRIKTLPDGNPWKAPAS